MLDIGEAHHVEQFDPGIADDRDLEAGDGACLHQSAQISPHGSARGLVGGRVVHSCVSCAGTAVKKRCLKAFLSGLPTAVSGMRSTISMRFGVRSEEHTSELQSLMRISYAVFCLKKKTTTNTRDTIE